VKIKNREYIKHLTGLFILVIFSMVVFGQQNWEYSYRISPFIRNITQSEYKAANQNWSVSQSENGVVYVANRLGLLEYNGSQWEIHSTESVHPLRAVLATDDIIYYGHFEDFGFFKHDNFGKLKRFSLAENLVPEKDMVNQNIWSINKIGDKIYFRSFGKIYIYDGEQVQIVFPGFGKTVFSLFEYKGLPFINILGEGLFYLDEKAAIHPTGDSTVLRDLRIINILPHTDSTDLLITEFNGIYIKSGENFIPWNTEANNFLKNCHQNKCIVIHDNSYAIGTIGSGVVLFDRNGEITAILDKINGLQNNTVLALLQDASKNLWVCLDKGIDYVEINSPFLYCLDRPGSLGSVYSAVLFNGKLYIGTNQGLFYTSWDSEKMKSTINFTRIEEAKGQVWELQKIGDKLICNYNLGALQIDEKGVKQIGEIGGFTATLHPDKDDIFFQGNYSGILTFFKNKSGDWQTGEWIYQSIGGAKSMYIDHLNNLWVGENFKNARLFRLDASADTILNSKILGPESGFNPRRNVGVFSFDKKVIFSNYDQFYTYDYISENVKPYLWLNNELGDYKGSSYMYKTNSNEYWFAKSDQIGMFRFDGEYLKLEKEISYNNLRGSAVDDRQNIWKIDSHEYIVGLDNGFLVYDANLEKEVIQTEAFPLKLIKANSSNEKGQKIDLQIEDNFVFEIPYPYKNLAFVFAIPGELPEHYSIAYKMDNDEWVLTSGSKSITFNYLRWGNHQLIVKAIDENENELSEASFTIRILPPWYLSVYAFAAYLIILALLIYAIVTFNRIRLQKQKLAYLKKIKSDNTRRIIKMKNQYLKTEVQNKSAELVNYTVLLGKKNEVLIRIKELLDKTGSKNGNQGNHSLKDVYDIIEHNLSSENDWKIFSSHFDEAHSNFLKKVKSDHPALTPNDLQLCAFLKMNLTSKEIAALLNISLRSVEVKRYRLRKKLDLEHDKNLVEYLLEV
jgi:DNA-binding CsgD family transcriptional regulator